METYLATASDLPASGLYNAAGRGFPDVSAQGTSYVVINNNITMPGVAGTRCAEIETSAYAIITKLVNYQLTL